MSAQLLLELLEKLLKLHKSLYQLALEKTAIVKNGDIEALNSLIINEQKHINAIQKVEKDQNELLVGLLPDIKSPTLKDCLSLFTGSELDTIRNLQLQLKNQLVQLKELNEFNQQLIELSLQYVMLNIDVLLPDDLTNYSNTLNEEDSPLKKVRLFDSKA